MNEVQGPPIKRPADPFPSYAALRARHSELLDLEPETEGDAAYLEEIQDFFERVRATGAILAIGEERRASQSILNYWTSVLYHADQKLSNTTLVELNPELKPKLEDQTCPYPGVHEFDETEGKYFFGRQRTIDYLLARLREETFLALVGPSGSGKSSFVRAGLLPAIKNIGLEEEHEELQRHFFPIITPGSDPLNNLASLLSGAIKSPESLTTEHYREKLQHNSQYLAAFLAEALVKPAVIVVDQFEELFTLCKDRNARRIFIDNLLALDRTKHRVILCTNIEDFGAALNRLPEFEKIFERGRTLLPRLGVAELTDAITKPADLVGFKFKDKTVKDIVQEIGTLPLALPLLQFTLVKLWEKRGEHDEYFAKIGGCRALLTQSAEEFLQSLEPQERDLAEIIFRRMVEFEYKYQARIMPIQLEAHAVPVRLRDLRHEIGAAKRVDAMVEQMSKAQLLRHSASSIPEDQQLELVHESLIRNWLRLSQWIEGQKRRRFRVASVNATALLILVAVGLFFAGVTARNLWQKFYLHEQASRWARESRKYLNDKRLDTAMLLSLAGHLTDPAGGTGRLDRFLYRGETGLQSRGALLSTLLFRPFPTAFLDQEGAGSVALGPVGLLAANDRDGTIRLWNLRASPRVVVAYLRGPSWQGTEIAPLIFSNDGRLLISGGAEEKNGTSENVVSLWEIKRSHVGWVGVTAFVGWRTPLSAPDDAGSIVALALSGNDKTLAALTRTDVSTKVTVWDTEAKQKLPSIPTETIQSIALSKAGEILATADIEGNVILWNVKRGSKIRTLTSCDCLKTLNNITSITFSPDGKQLAVSGSQETVLWSRSDIRGTGETELWSNSILLPTQLAAGSRGSGMILAFSERGDMLAGFEGNSPVYLWSMASEGPKRIGENFFQQVTPATRWAFSQDARTLASRGEQGITLWDLSVPEPTKSHADEITDLAFSPKDPIMASSSNDGTVNLWNTTNGEFKELPNNDLSSVLSLAFSNNGKFLAAGLYSGKVLLRNIENGSTVSLESADQQTADYSAVAFSRDDKTLVSVSARGSKVQVNEWDVDSKNRSGGNSPDLKEGTVRAMCLSPDGKRLALATDRRALLIWDIAQETLTTHPEIFATPIRGLKFSQDGRWLVAGGVDSDSVFRYEVSEFNKKPVPIFLEGLSGTIFDLAFSLDGKILAVVVTPIQGDPESLEARRPGILVLVDIEKPQVITEALRFHDSIIMAVAFRHDQIATGSLDGKVLLSDLNTCQAKRRVCSVVNRSFTEEEKTQHSIEGAPANLCENALERKECR